MFPYTNIKIQFSIITPIALVPFAMGLFLTFPSAHAQTLEGTLQQATDKIGELQAIEQNKGLSNEEKAQLEIYTRKEALQKILELTLLEDKELRSKLDAIENLNEEEEAIRERLHAIFDEHEKAYGILHTRIEATNNLEEIKQLASDFKNWRKAAYDPRMKHVVDFTLVFRQRAILDITQSRLNKIISDLKKLEGAKLLTSQDTSAPLQRAIEEIKKAKELNNQALNEVISAMRPAYEKDEDEGAEEELQEQSIESAQSEEMGASLTEEVESDESDGEEEGVETEETKDARAFVEGSLEHIKGAYQNFIEISKIVRTKLGIK